MIRRPLPVLALLFLATTTALATHPQKWLADNEESFSHGTMDKVALTSRGELKLSRELKSLLPEDAEVGQVFALAQARDGTFYAAVSGDQTTGKILAIRDGKSRVAAEVELTPLFSSNMFFDAQGRLIVGGCGDSARVLRFTFPAAGTATTAPATTEPTTEPTVKPEVLYEDADSKYVWALAPAPDGTIYAATGPTGKLVAIPAGGGKPEVAFSIEEGNFLSLAITKEGIVYVGSDPHAVVYRFDPKTKKSTVVLSTKESEIAALRVDAAGNVYAATGEPVEPGGNDQPAPRHKGMPDIGGNEPKETPFPPAKPPMQPPTPSPKRPKGGGSPFGAFRAAPPLPSKLPAGPGGIAKLNKLPPGLIAPPHHGGDSDASAEGNAVYKIDPDGFISEVFRAPVTIRAMVERDGVLTLGTGPDGEIYEVDTRRDESGVIATADTQNVSCLLALPDGSIAVGLANEGGVATLSTGLAPTGTYTTEVFDASGVARLGMLRLDGSLPLDTAVTLSTRSGNVEQPGASWSDWTAEAPAQKFTKITSPAARYFQARLTFTTKGNATPIVRAVEATYQLPNASPVVSSVAVDDVSPDDNKTPADAPKGSVKHISWEAHDPNEDAMTYTLEYRPSDETEWRPLKDKITDTSFDWDTKAVKDGRYQVRVVASDAPDNEAGTEKKASRVSSSFLIDNTPPTFAEVTSKIEGNSAILHFTVSDAASTVVGVKWRDGATGEWRTAEAEDKMFDSPSEAVSVTVRDLTPGRHIIALKAVDDRGNESYENVSVEVK